MDAGTVLRGKYRIDRTLGVGGMGQVLLATHLRLGQRVAIKILHASGLEKPEMVERFAREARAAATLTSDHVVRILDVDETEERVPFFVMEYLSGEDLEHLLARAGPLSVPRAVDVVLDACEALAEAHAAGIVHRDLKPANLFLTKRASGAELVKVLDFGISKAMTPEASIALTTTQTVMGSPLYMSPEQLRASRDVDGRTDIWSLGIVLYQLLTGQLPFTGTNATAVAACIAADPPASLRDVRDDVPESIERTILRCLEKRPADRFASMVELARALAEFASSPNRADAVERAATRHTDSDRRVASPTAATEPARGRQTETLPEVPEAPPRSSSAPVPKEDGSSTEASSVALLKPAEAPKRRHGLVIAAAAAALAVIGAAALRSTSYPPPTSRRPPLEPVGSSNSVASGEPPPERPTAEVMTAAPSPPAVDASDSAPQGSTSARPIRTRRPATSPPKMGDPLEVDIK